MKPVQTKGGEQYTSVGSSVSKESKGNMTTTASTTGGIDATHLSPEAKAVLTPRIPWNPGR